MIMLLPPEISELFSGFWSLSGPLCIGKYLPMVNVDVKLGSRLIQEKEKTREERSYCQIYCNTSVQGLDYFHLLMCMRMEFIYFRHHVNVSCDFFDQHLFPLVHNAAKLIRKDTRRSEKDNLS